MTECTTGSEYIRLYVRGEWTIWRPAPAVAASGMSASGRRETAGAMEVYDLGGGTKLGPGEDIDSVFRPGTYALDKRTDLFEAGRLPTPNISTLTVRRAPSSNSIMQLLSDLTTGDEFSRVRKGNTWGSWKKTAYINDTDKAVRSFKAELNTFRQERSADARNSDAKLSKLEDDLKALNAEINSTQCEIKKAEKRRTEELSARDREIQRLSGELEQTRNIWLLRLLRKISRIVHGK